MNSLNRIIKIINESREQLRTEFGVVEIGIFGSVVHELHDADSDIDILVELERPVGFVRFIRLEKRLSELLGMPVDLVTKKALKPHIGKEILVQQFESVNRTLQQNQEKIILDQFEKNGSPLYLKLAIEEAIHWKSYDTKSCILAADTKGLIRNLITRLKVEFGDELVNKTLSYIALAKNGLNEHEILEILTLDKKFFDDKLKIAPLAGGFIVSDWEDIKNNFAIVYIPSISYMATDNAEISLSTAILEGKGANIFANLSEFNMMMFKLKYSF